MRGAWVLAKELFGWRQFDNRRQLAGSIGLVPRRTPAAIACASKASANREQTRALAAGGAGVGLARSQTEESSRAGSTGALLPRASACAASASSRWHGGWLWRCGATCATARSRPAPRSNRCTPEAHMNCPPAQAMVQGRRAVVAPGRCAAAVSRWGASATGGSAKRFARMLHRVAASCAPWIEGGSSVWLERCSTLRPRTDRHHRPLQWPSPKAPP